MPVEPYLGRHDIPIHFARACPRHRTTAGEGTQVFRERDLRAPAVASRLRTSLEIVRGMLTFSRDRAVKPETPHDRQRERERERELSERATTMIVV